MRTEIWILIIAILVGGCAGFYGAMKAIERKGQKRRQVTCSRVPHLTLLYVKDWVKTELGSSTTRTVSLIQPDIMGDVDERQTMEALIPDSIQQSASHALLLMVKERGEIRRTHALQYETMDEDLRQHMQQAGGVLNIQRN